ncbi:uncharacterized protein LOC115214393 [Argonauta hians]
METWSLCLLWMGMSLVLLTQESLSAPLIGPRRHMSHNSPLTASRSRHNTRGGRTKNRRYYLKLSHHLNQVQPVMSSNIKSRRDPGHRVISEHVNDISESKLYHLLPYEAVENTNTPERQAYRFKAFSGFISRKKKAQHRRKKNKMELATYKSVRSYQYI